MRMWLCALMLMMAVPVWAQPKAEVVVMPLEMPGYDSPTDVELLTKRLETSVAKQAPNAKLQHTRPADLTAYGYRAGTDQPPSLDMASKICRAYGASYLCWASVDFAPDYNRDTGAFALGGAARFWFYSVDQGKVTIDQPISLVRVGQVKDVDNQKAARAEAERLALGIMDDLAFQMVGVARQRQQKPPASVGTWNAPPADATQSRNYKSMVSAAKAYQRAVRDSDAINITQTTADMQRTWTMLNQSERTAISKNYPDLEKLMTTQAPSYYGGGYWPYGYRY